MPKLTIPIPAEARELPLRLALAIKAARLTQGELGKRTGIAQSAISRLLSERPSGGLVAHVVTLAIALDVRVGWLLVGEEPMRPPGSRAPIVIDADAQAKRPAHVAMRAKNKRR